MDIKLKNKKQKHEINAVNLTSTKPPTPSREAAPTPKAAKSNKWGKEREGKKKKTVAMPGQTFWLI